MDNKQFKAAQSATAAAISQCFLELHALGKPLPEGVELVPNGTGYFDETVTQFRNVPEVRHEMFATKDDLGRKVLIVPLANFSALQHGNLRKAAERKDALVFFERYTDGPGIIIEQETQLNNADMEKTFHMAALIAIVGDWLI